MNAKGTYLNKSARCADESARFAYAAAIAARAGDSDGARQADERAARLSALATDYAKAARRAAH